MIKKIIKFIKSEMMLSVSVAMALVSLFVTKPTTKILYDIDWKTLAVLFMLLLVLDGFKNQNLFEPVVNMASKIKSKIGLSIFFVFGVFVTSMLVTNDVSLIIYVPLTMIVFRKINAQEYILPLLVLENIAAIRGSLLTPFGSPQNLYLFENSRINALEFIEMMAPACIISAVLLLVFIVVINQIIMRTSSRKHMDSADETTAANGKIYDTEFQVNDSYNMTNSKCNDKQSDCSCDKNDTNNKPYNKNYVKYGYIALFILVVFTIVSRIEMWYVVLGIVVFILAIIDREVFKRVDYVLIFTFLCFFVFSSQIAANPTVSGILRSCVNGHEYASSIILSQLISNVPTSIVLWPFSSDLKALIYGLDSAGLVGIIGSLASLINLRLYVKEYPGCGLKFLKVFEIISLAFFVIICGLQLLIL